MAEGHIEFTLSVCVCVLVHLCVPESCPAHNFVLHFQISGTDDHHDIVLDAKTMLLGQRSRSIPTLKVLGTKMTSIIHFHFILFSSSFSFRCISHYYMYCLYTYSVIMTDLW